MKIRLAFISIERNAYSETFIKAQRELLSADITFLWNMGRDSDKGAILNHQGLKNYFLTNEIEMVFAQFGPTGVSVLDVCKDLRLPLIVHFHGFDAYSNKALNTFGSRYKELFYYASSIIAVSKDMINKLLSLGAPADKIIYAPYGVNDIYFGNIPSFKTETFVAVGRFVGKKGPHLTVSAFKEVLRQAPNAKLIMIGGGDALLEVCIDLAYSWGIENSIEFKGILSPAQICEVFRSCYCFVQHSVTTPLIEDAEGTPLSVLEASAAGLPVISTKHKGINQAIIADKTGYLVNERDVRGMADYMIYLLSDKSTALKMGSAGREHIRQEYSMTQYINILNEALHNSLKK